MCVRPPNKSRRPPWPRVSHNGDADKLWRGHCEKMMFRPYMSGLQSVEVTLEAERLDVLVNTPGAYMEIG